MKVLVPLDGSDVSRSILPTARRLLELVPAAELHLLTVLERGRIAGRRERTVVEVLPAVVGQVVVDQPFPRLVESHGEAMERLHHETIEELDALAADHFPAGGWVSHITWSDDPVDAIIELADRLEVDVIAMATHGRSGLAHLVAGSVAEGVIRRSGRPVLVQTPPMLGRS